MTDAAAAGADNARRIRYAAACIENRVSEAVAKHGVEHTPLSPAMGSREKLAILVEEVGEVAKCLTYDNWNRVELMKELEQVGAVATMWRAALAGVPDDTA